MLMPGNPSVKDSDNMFNNLQQRHVSVEGGIRFHKVP